MAVGQGTPKSAKTKSATAEFKGTLKPWFDAELYWRQVNYLRKIFFKKYIKIARWTLWKQKKNWTAKKFET